MPTATIKTRQFKTTNKTNNNSKGNTVTKNSNFSLANHPLAGFVPDRAKYFDTYVSREIHGVVDMDLIRIIHEQKHNLMLAGPTGAAKTSFVYAYAASIGMPVVNVACNGGVDVRQLIGGWTPQAGGGFDFSPGDLVLGVQHGAIILLNELNFMPAKIAAVVFGLLDRRRTVYIPDARGSSFPTVVEAHPKTLIVADYNPGYQGTRPLNEALANRFAHKVSWGYEHDIEEALLNSAALLEMAEKLRGRIDNGDLTTPVPTNALIEFEVNCFAEGLSFQYAVGNFVARFQLDEQAVVREVITMYSDRIKADLFD